MESIIKQDQDPSNLQSKVYIAAKNFEKGDFDYLPSKVWEYDSIFNFTSQEIQNHAEDGVQNVKPTDEMQRFQPLEEEMTFKSDKTMQRLMFYS